MENITTSAIVRSLNERTIEIELPDGNHVALNISSPLKDVAIGQTIWLTISSEEPSDPKTVLNTLLGTR